MPGAGDPARIYAEFDAGATIVLQSLQRTWLPVARFCRRLELELSHPVQANAYITPPGERGLGVHYDTHDVFVLQLAGRKRWTLYEPVFELPLPSQPWSASTSSAGDELLDVELAPGDCLYVPRGVPHEATSLDGMSAHLTLGVLAVTWHDVAQELVAAAADEVAFRRSLPVGFAGGRRAARGDAGPRLPAARVAGQGRHRRRRRAHRPALLDRPPAHSRRPARPAGGARSLSDRSTVCRQPSAICRLSVVDDELVVLLGDRELRMPAGLGPLVARLTAGAPMQVGDLADAADGESRLVLVRRLVREGVLEVLPE